MSSSRNSGPADPSAFGSGARPAWPFETSSIAGVDAGTASGSRRPGRAARGLGGGSGL